MFPDRAPVPARRPARPARGLVLAGGAIVLVVLALLVTAAVLRGSGQPTVTPTSAAFTPPPTSDLSTTGSTTDSTGSSTTDSSTGDATSSDPSTSNPSTSDPSTSEPPTTAPPTGSADGLVALDPNVTTTAAPEVVAAVLTTFDSYFSNINAGRASAAYQVYSPGEQGKNPYGAWSRGIGQTQVSDLSVNQVDAGSGVPGGPASVQVSFTSRQPGSLGPVKGQTCTHWSLTYSLVPDATGTRYLIDDAQPGPGGGHTGC